jgi:hypothetical protein
MLAVQSYCRWKGKKSGEKAMKKRKLVGKEIASL